jgi:CHAD domain-containing protein
MTFRPEASAFAACAILDRAGAFMREIPAAVASDDPEGVHRARVASRRLEMALRLLGERAGLPVAADCLKLVRSAARVLGEVRDLDVQIAWLEDFAVSRPAREKPGVGRLALRLSQRRAKLRDGVRRSLSGLPGRAAWRNTVQSLRGVLFDTEMSGDAGRPDDGTYIARAMSVRIDGIIQAAASLASPGAHSAHHKLRIEIKRLRYAMEIANGLFGGSMDPYIALAKKAQDLLGDLHDANVWVEEIPRLMSRERSRAERYFGAARPFARLAPGYAAVAADRAAARDEWYEKAVYFWNETANAGRWNGLRMTLLDAVRGNGHENVS